ncbi:MAG: L-glutamate gamma-semialdehyde dehydrogenase [Deltaproteobacteria bacterium]|nr:L-glutamate gamma-semialdehyde dehydrogenase [Deltaproteobacteria bacterium]
MTVNLSPFQNEALTDFSRDESILKMEEALTQVQQEFGREYPLVIHGEKVKSGQKMRSLNPADPNEVVGVVQRASVTQGEQAIASATQAFGEERYGKGWRWQRPETRVKYLVKTAEVMRRRRLELAACLVFEVGKSWVEADADVAEAIDFCEFYAREALRYGADQPVGSLPGEKNALVYIPLGVGVVIPPWNFPLAILTGMTVASWVTGNTVVLKPSSDAPVIAAKFMEIMEEVGLPPGVVNFLTGPGGEVGSRLVTDPRTRFVAFTGSRDVGLQIVEKAAVHQSGQRWIKRVIAEMGGKDAIIVDDEADLPAAVDGVVASAFGFQGQKCSACSRAIVCAPVYEAFLARLQECVNKITMGPPKDRKNTLGPVVNEKQCNVIEGYFDIGKREGRLLCGGHRIASDGYFLEPTVIVDVDAKARIAQEEIFGPLLAVIKVATFDEALRVANGTDYGLTGGVFSANQEKSDLAKEVFHVGNLYVNRKCTGAMVGAHPFGGFNMSGTDSKAGGRDYLLLFLQAKSVAEKC